MTFVNDIYNTKHLAKRIRERAGLPKRSHARFLSKAKNGKTLKNLENKVLCNYVKSITIEHCQIILHNTYGIVVSNDGVGITLLQIPKEYLKIMKGVKSHVDGNTYIDQNSRCIERMPTRKKHEASYQL